MAEENYEVGYGKPPKHTRFKPGQSGNPQGRPPKTRNFKTDLLEELSGQITVTEGGKSKTISRQQAMIKRTIEKALKGDLRAIQMLSQWVAMRAPDDPDTLATLPLDEADLALLERHGLNRENPSSDSEGDDSD